MYCISQTKNIDAFTLTKVHSGTDISVAGFGYFLNFCWIIYKSFDVWKDAFSVSVGEFRYRLVRKQLQDDATGRRVLEHGQYFQSWRVQPLLSARVKVHPLISTFYLDCVIDFVDKQRVLFHPASALDVPVSRLRQESVAGCTRCMAHAHCSRSG